jgi:hypothetical protein
MQIVHRISIAGSPRIRAELANYGLVVPAEGLVTFEVDETHESWSLLKEWIHDHQAVDVVLTKFSRAEICAATWLELEPVWHNGYPEPDRENLGYLAATYDLNDYCAECGLGLRQHAPFQLRREPKWGRNEIFQLNWIFDEYFVTPALYEAVFAPAGIACREVLNTKGGVLSGVVQLAPSEYVPLSLERRASELCGRCGRNRYRPVPAGPCPAMRREPSTGLAKTEEWFGSGNAAYHQMIISQELWRAIETRGSRGAAVRPVAESRAPR